MQKTSSILFLLALAAVSATSQHAIAAKKAAAKTKVEATEKWPEPPAVKTEEHTLIQEQWPNAKFDLSNESLRSLYGVMDKGFEDPYIYWLYTRSHNRLVRSELEFEVAEVLDNHPVALNIRNKIAKDIDDAVASYRLEHLKGAAKAYESESSTGAEDAQYGDFLKLTRDLAQVMGFPKAARDNAEIFYLSDPTVNAYTFSGRQSKIIAAIYHGLWDLFGQDPKVLKPVMAHELQHIMGRHIAMRSELIAIFLSTAIDLIPDIDDDVKEKGAKGEGEEELKSKVRAALLKGGYAEIAPVIMEAKKLGAEILEEPIVQAAIAKRIESLGFSLNSHEAHQLKSHYAETTGNDFASKLLQIAMQLRADINKKDRMDLAAKLMKTSGERVKKVSADGDEEEPVVSIKEFKKFMMKINGVWSRSNEKTCDHMARATSLTSKEAAMPFVKMLGGKGATYEGMLRQGRELKAEQVIDNSLVVEEGSHPAIEERIAYMDQYAATEGFKIVTDPYLKAVHFYLLLSQEIADQERAASSDRKGSVPMGVASYKTETAKAFAAQLADWLKIELDKEYQAALASIGSINDAKGLEKIDTMLKKHQTLLDILSSGNDNYYFDYYFQRGRRNITWSDWLKTMSKPNRLPYDLKAKLSSEKRRLEKELGADAQVVAKDAGKESDKLAGDKVRQLNWQLTLVSQLLSQLETLLPYESQSSGQQLVSGLKEACQELLTDGD